MPVKDISGCIGQITRSNAYSLLKLDRSPKILGFCYWLMKIVGNIERRCLNLIAFKFIYNFPITEPQGLTANKLTTINELPKS